MSWPPENGSLLPNPDHAYGVHEKLAGYSLKLDHVGRGKKAEGFARVLGITVADLEYLAGTLLSGIRTTPMSNVRLAGEHGAHCEVILLCVAFGIAPTERQVSCQPGRSVGTVTRRG